MKQLHVISSPQPAEEYGVARYASELARATGLRGHDVHLQTSSIDVPGGEDAREGVTFRSLKEEYPFFAYSDCLQTMLTNIPLTKRIVELWESSGPFDVILCHDWQASIAGVTAREVFQCPLIVVLHGTQLGRMSGRGTAEQMYIVEMEKWACRKADRIVVPSEFVRRELERHYSVPAGAASVIPGGVRAEAFSAAVDLPEFRGMFAAPEEPLVLYSGRLSPEKGADLFVEAAQAALRGYPRGRFVMAGDGPMRPFLAEVIEKRGLSDRVRMTGYLGTNVLGALYQASDVFALPSRYEASGISALEALAHGLPVLASSCDALSEVASAFGPGRMKPVPIGDSRAMGQAMAETLRSQGLRTGERRASQTRVPARCSWSAAAESAEALVHSLFVPAPG